MLKKFNIGVVLILIALMGVTLGCSKSKRIILLTNGDDPFWDAMRSGMEQAARDLDLGSTNLRVVMDKNDATAQGQVEKLRQYIAQTDVAAVGISVIDPNNAAMAAAMRDLRNRGVVVVTIDSDVNRDRFKDTRFAYLGTENTFGGRQMGLAAKKLRPEGGKYATFYGIEGVANVIERNTGFANGAGDNFVKAGGFADNMKSDVAQDNVRNALQNHPDLDTLVGIWAYDAHAIVTVVDEKSIRDKVTVVVFDAAPKAIAHIKAGKIDAMVAQNPYEMGYQGTRLMRALLEDDANVIRELYPGYDPASKTITTPDGDIHHTDVRVIVPAGSPLVKEDFDPEIKFYSISEFDSWLKERGLTGS
ncbi:MAG TPA: substrate-binding domain-containing protein [Pirellulaceae bacterium]|nr:substrate-binding domain-containing protein [Pirellulaceae bacterium]HMO91176.1 substrate-binding domain-containing protein [Pirellulaceae bacterium]HMP69054.1 substrate-binding domain-containing protein [Pirellulaceae bacterium]